MTEDEKSDALAFVGLDKESVNETVVTVGKREPS